MEHLGLMGRQSLFRSVKALIDEFRSHGKPELQRLRAEAEALRAELQAVKATRQGLERNQEALVLAHLKGALTKIQAADNHQQLQKASVDTAAEAVGKQAALVEEAAARQKAMERAMDLVEKVDIGKYVLEGAPVQECLREERAAPDLSRVRRDPGDEPEGKG